MHVHLSPDSIYPFDARGIAKRFRHAAIFGALQYFGQALDLSDPATLEVALRSAGFDPAEVGALAADAEVKQALIRATEEAVTRGIFGAPTFFVGDELFWGQDRMEFVAAALAR